LAGSFSIAVVAAANVTAVAATRTTVAAGVTGPIAAAVGLAGTTSLCLGMEQEEAQVWLLFAETLALYYWCCNKYSATGFLLLNGRIQKEAHSASNKMRITPLSRSRCRPNFFSQMSWTKCFLTRCVSKQSP
jgi:hypothetical protein